MPPSPFLQRLRTQGFRLNTTAPRLLLHTFNLALFVHFFLTYGYSVAPTYGASMVPTIAAVGDAVLISKRHRRGRDIEVGDVVSYRHPYKLGEGVIKRVIGMPGDFVLRDTPGVGEGVMLQVPAGHCWVAGDNQKHSRDSRMHGPVPLAMIKGKVIAKVWPPSHMGWFRNGLQEPLQE